jgi:hypothetical protein
MNGLLDTATSDTITMYYNELEYMTRVVGCDKGVGGGTAS